MGNWARSWKCYTVDLTILSGVYADVCTGLRHGPWPPVDHMDLMSALFAVSPNRVATLEFTILANRPEYVLVGENKNARKVFDWMRNDSCSWRVARKVTAIKWGKCYNLAEMSLAKLTTLLGTSSEIAYNNRMAHQKYLRRCYYYVSVFAPYWVID